MRRDRRNIKFSKWCARCKRAGKRRVALRWSNGSYDSYCRTCKREVSATYMFSRRIDDPGYGNRRGKR